MRRARSQNTRAWALAFALLAACALAVGAFAAAGAWPAYADNDDADGSAAEADAEDAEGAADESAGVVEELDADGSSDDAADEDEAQDDSGAEALDADGNEVDSAQLPDSSFIYDTSIADLSTADTYYDGQTVQVVGEVVGDSINASQNGSYQWISLAEEDGSAVVAVYMNSEAAAKIDTFGGYGATGTTLQVRGTFHLACDEHDGATDLHADVVTVTARGTQDAEQLDLRDFLPGVVAVGAGLLMMLVYWLLRERQR